MERSIRVVAAVAMFAFMILTVLDVVGRNVLGRPLRGAIEMTEIGMVTITFLLFPILAIQNGHIVADMADSLRSRLLDVIKIVLTALCGAGLFAMISWRMWLMAQRSAGYSEVSPTLGIPLTPVLFGVSILAAITAICFLIRLRDLARPSSAVADASPETIL